MDSPHSQIVDRAFAVNLAKSIQDGMDLSRVMPVGIAALADAVLRMDAALSDGPSDDATAEALGEVRATLSILRAGGIANAVPALELAEQAIVGIRPRSFMSKRLLKWQKQFHPDNETGELLQEAAARIEELERQSAGAERE